MKLENLLGHKSASQYTFFGVCGDLEFHSTTFSDSVRISSILFLALALFLFYTRYTTLTHILHMETPADSDMMLEKLLPSAQSVILVSIAVLLSVIYYLVQTENQKKALRQNLAAWLPRITRGRRSSTSKTPPRSLTPEKKVPDNILPTEKHKDTFPPSPRGNLPIWTRSWKSIWATLNRFESDEDNQEFLQQNLIPWETDYRKCDPSTYTPMEISIGEVKALGDFPDYSKLSGVPLPEAYKEFEIEKAIPRPYRPFRWAYHQTMCRPLISTILCSG